MSQARSPQRPLTGKPLAAQMIVIKSTGELAAIVCKVARQLESYQFDIISDLHQAATVLEGLAERQPKANADQEALLNILEDG
jgi:hypothetical protein